MAGAAAYPVHLLVVCHGLWGSRSHIGYICKTASQFADDGKMQPWRSSQDDKPLPHKLVVLPAKLNEWTNTYDGIDVCAERVVNEIDQEIELIKQQGGDVKRFSIVGYSLGGLVARYVLGLLESREPSFFKDVTPVNFTTFASPAIGIPSYNSFWSSTFRFLGARLLSRSGSQLYEHDRFLPTTAMQHDHKQAQAEGTKCGKSKGAWMSKLPFASRKPQAEPLLAVMADPRYNFYKALAAFEKIDVYCNTVNDRTVPFPTGSISAHDPFALARSKAQKRAEARGDEPDAVLDLADGGLEITLQPDAPIISSYKEVTPPELTPEQSKARRWRFRLPLLLRPTTYPFSRPVSLLVIACLPVALPLSLMYLIGRFVLQARASRQRIKDIRKATGGGREGMLARVGVKIGEVAEQVGVDNPEYAAGLDDGSGSGASAQSSNANDIQVLNGDPRTTEDDEDYGRRKQHPGLADLASYGGSDTPPFARSIGPTTSTSRLAAVDKIDPGTRAAFSTSSSSSSTNPKSAAVQQNVATDPILSSAQLTMIHHLNSIPHLTKHFVYLPHARNSHGAMIARDLSWPQHHQGKKVIESWAEHFQL
ncbi:hypothetical protein OIV83_003509 [Microbotryomycetes sp. JL201]|nr:hypothetical protein OIV83_003509 [Microbotryomycetes sp. JL201]